MYAHGVRRFRFLSDGSVQDLVLQSACRDLYAFAFGVLCEELLAFLFGFDRQVHYIVDAGLELLIVELFFSVLHQILSNGSA